MASKAAEKTARHRARQRARGLRRVEPWVYDTASPEFQERLRRSAAIMRARSAEEQEALAWCEAMTAEVWAEIDAAERRASRK